VSLWQNGVEDDDEMFAEASPDLDIGGILRRRAELIRIREAEEALLLGQRFDFCWNPTLGLKLRNGTVANLHTYVTYC
jgi:hypothetical protein